MQIQGAHQVHQAHGLNGPHTQRPHQAAPSNPMQGADQVDISPAAQAASQARGAEGIRHDLVAQLRSEIASGNYETQGKLEHALDRLLDAIG